MRQTRWDYTTTARVTTTHISGENRRFYEAQYLKRMAANRTVWPFHQGLLRALFQHYRLGRTVPFAQHTPFA